MSDHIEPLENHTPPPRGRATGNALAFIVVAVLLLVGWRYMRPNSALASSGWMTDWDQAVEKSRETGKPALVLFTADWCPACRQFESQTLRDPAVQKYLAQNHTLVVVDLSDQDGPNMERARECGIRGIPTLIRYNGSGQEVARSHGMSAGDLLRWLK